MSKYIWTVFFLCAGFCNAQNKRIDNLVFEGAGIRGLAYCGVIQELEANGKIPQLKRIGGTSAGAITALLLSLGYTSKEIEKIISTTHYNKFNDGGIPFFGGMHRLQKKFGWYKGRKFEKWLAELIASKTGDANINFKTLASKYIPLYITGTSLNAQKAFIFSAENYPDMKVLDAVRISMSIPLYYTAVVIDDAGKRYAKPLKNKPYHIMVDGGFLNNFPIEIFDSSKYFMPGSDNKPMINPYTLGCRIDNANQIVLDKDPNNRVLAPISIKSFGNYMRAFMVLNMEQLSRQKLTGADWERTISIADGGIGPKVKKMKKATVVKLIENGKTATSLYFKAKNL